MLHNGQLRYRQVVYPASNIIRASMFRTRPTGHVARMGEKIMRSVLVGEPKGKTQLEKLKHKGKNNIKTDINRPV